MQYYASDKLIDQLVRHEQFQAMLYPDSLSKLFAMCGHYGLSPYNGGYRAIPGWQKMGGEPWTIGYGHNHTATPIPGIGHESIMSKDQARRLLYTDAELVGSALLDAFPWMNEMPSTRFAVFVNMGYNMGVAGLSEFRKTLVAAEKGNYSMCADQMLESKWASQVGNYSPNSPRGVKYGRPGRAWELSEQMRTGEWWDNDA